MTLKLGKPKPSLGIVNSQFELLAVAEMHMGLGLGSALDCCQGCLGLGRAGQTSLVISVWLVPFCMEFYTTEACPP